MFIAVGTDWDSLCLCCSSSDAVPVPLLLDVPSLMPVSDAAAAGARPDLCLAQASGLTLPLSSAFRLSSKLEPVKCEIVLLLLVDDDEEDDTDALSLLMLLLLLLSLSSCIGTTLASSVVALLSFLVGCEDDDDDDVEAEG